MKLHVVLLVVAFQLVSADERKFYAIKGRIFCNGAVIPKFVFKTVEHDTFKDDVREYYAYQSTIDLEAFDDDGFFNFDLELELIIPFKCGSCQGAIVRNIGTNYQFDSLAAAQSNVYRFGDIELSKLCRYFFSY
uniref:Transthyretin-like family protein n=1 Tax=Panagrellus redivivus TaxID=6233 RepID=A0A7E4ZQA5_PANRE